MKPFANESEAMAIGDLSIENGTSVITVSGNLEIGQDKTGLKRAQGLKEIISAIVAKLEESNDLPDKVDIPATSSTQVPNPFS